MFTGLPVGCFEGSEYPQRNGQYVYMPYRGPGHLKMQTERRKIGHARCYYDVGAERISFTVVDCPTYGVLELADFERLQREPGE
jgi:hypothetical protein